MQEPCGMKFSTISEIMAYFMKLFAWNRAQHELICEVLDLPSSWGCCRWRNPHAERDDDAECTRKTTNSRRLVFQRRCARRTASRLVVGRRTRRMLPHSCRCRTKRPNMLRVFVNVHGRKVGTKFIRNITNSQHYGLGYEFDPQTFFLKFANMLRTPVRSRTKTPDSELRKSSCIFLKIRIRICSVLLLTFMFRFGLDFGQTALMDLQRH